MWFSARRSPSSQLGASPMARVTRWRRPSHLVRSVTPLERVVGMLERVVGEAEVPLPGGHRTHVHEGHEDAERNLAMVAAARQQTQSELPPVLNADDLF